MIRVNDDYIIEIDAFNYTAKLDRHYTKKQTDLKTGEVKDVPVFSIVGYYSDLTSAIKGIIEYMNYRALSDGVHDLKEAVEIVIKHNRLVSDLLEKALEV